MSDTHDAFPPELIDRYLAGVCTDADQAYLTRYLAGRPDVEERLALTRTLLAGPAAGVAPPPAEPRIAVVLEQIHQEHAPEPKQPSTPRTGSRGLGASVARLAALGVVVALIAVVVWPHRQAAPRAVATYDTAPGQVTTVRLADGSRVMLAPRSHLEIAHGFGATSRTVTLRGEAYFTVTPAPEAPFIVRTGSITTRVLGTTFNVRQDTADGAVHVFVQSGKVVTSGSRASVTLAAGALGRVTDSTATTQTAGDAETYTGWTNGRLAFDGTPARAVLAEIGRWYGYQFRLTDTAMASRRLTTVLNVGNAQETLAAIAQLLDVTVTLEGSTVTLHPRRAARPVKSSRPARSFVSPALENGK